MRLGDKVTNPGEMNKRITIQSVAATLDTEGDTSYAYTTIFSTWARVRTPFGRTLIEGYVAQVEVPLEVRIRYNVLMNDKCVAQIDGVMHDVKSLRDIDLRHEYMDFFAVVRKAD